ncbi:MAG: lysophospholipid acyltransferase family protein [Nitrospirota bacterium]
MATIQQDRIFKLAAPFPDPLRRALFSMMQGPVEHMLAFPRLNEAYADVKRQDDGRSFFDKALDRLGVAYDCPAEDLRRLGQVSGPAIIVANHPFGGIEGLILSSLLTSLRCDVKFMANHLLGIIPEMRDLIITVDVMGGTGSMARNIRPLRECIRHVKCGGMLVVFPAGTVSHLDVRYGAVMDPSWSTAVARLARTTGAAVVPLFFHGTNSAWFQLAGLVHPLLRTALLPGELLNKQRRVVQMRIGPPIPFERLDSFPSDALMTDHLRFRTYVMEHLAPAAPRRNTPSLSPRMTAVVSERIAAPRNPALMAEEIALLPADQVLVENSDQIVIQAEAGQIPCLLFEIGRLREATFRAVGEGTGKSLDLDRFDDHYLHLVIWNRARREVVGAYRMAKSDEIMGTYGTGGLYTSTLFRYRQDLIERMGPALELGRSFIRREYQRSYAPLLLLWKGIGRYIVRHPRYRTLFGPVSISRDYRDLSRRIMVSYLKAHCYRNDLAGLVRPRTGLRDRPLRGLDTDTAMTVMGRDIDALSSLIAEIEPDGKGVPVLLRQYLKLNGGVAGFNIDREFGNVLDALIIVDLTKTDPKVLPRYLGKDGAESFLAFQGIGSDRRFASCA